MNRSTTEEAARPRAGRLVDDIGYEILPLEGVEAAVLASVPRGTRITITASPTRRLPAVLDLAERLSHHGYRVAPHLPARLIHDQAEVREIVGRLADAHITDAFGLLRAMTAAGHELTDVGIGGYPEGRAVIDDAHLWQALVEKAPLATRIVTQVCFDADAILRWAEEVRRRGIELPIYVGVPGAVSRRKLVRISATIGLGASARFLRKRQGMFWRFFLPRGYSPSRLIDRLDSRLDSSPASLAGLHMFTFNEVASTERWRTRRKVAKP